MVVDIRYHLASLVAVFFSLGLGILVGMSISSDEKGSELREQWMAAIESELEAVRTERRETASRLEVALGERDLYKTFAGDIVTALIDGRLADGRTEVVVIGDPTASTDRILETLERAGADAVGPARIMDISDDHLVSELTSRGTPRRVVAVLSGPPSEHRQAFEALLEVVKASGADVAAVLDGQPAWRPVLDDYGIGYVTHVDSPPGALSLVYLLATGERGRYGADTDLPGWPDHLFELLGAAGERR